MTIKIIDTMFWSKICKNPVIIAGCVLVFIIILSLLSKIATGESRPVAKETIKQTHTIITAANKWASMAKQDSNHVIALINISKAIAYLEVLRRVLTDDELKKAHDGIIVKDEIDKLENMQSSILQKISKHAPSLMPKDSYAVQTGWIG